MRFLKALAIGTAVTLLLALALVGLLILGTTVNAALQGAFGWSAEEATSVMMLSFIFVSLLGFAVFTAYMYLP